MKSTRYLIALIAAAAAFAPIYAFAAVQLELSSTTVLQGEPVLLTLRGAATTTTITKLLFDGKPIGVFTYHRMPAALIGSDLRQKTGDYAIAATLSDGTALAQTLTVAERPKIEEPFSIPDKLGGDSAQSASVLVASLAAENATLTNIKTGSKAYWTGNFRWPLSNIVMTDPYGYSRQTSGYSIAHKGTDFRAKEGTPVMSINRGVVRIAKTYRDYGKTVVVDHGLGVQSFYMHLSKINVTPGQLVSAGQTLGLSGQTGYAAQPHLHLTIRINGVSVDPMIFFSLFT